MALSQENIKSLISLQFIRGEAQQTAQDILKVQRSIAANHKQSGYLQSLLAKANYSVVLRGNGVAMSIVYPLHIRFMDMKRIKGKQKTYYQPIYNKIVWGNVYGYLYRKLVYGISSRLNQIIYSKLLNSGFKIN